MCCNNLDQSNYIINTMTIRTVSMSSCVKHIMLLKPHVQQLITLVGYQNGECSVSIIKNKKRVNAK